MIYKNERRNKLKLFMISIICTCLIAIVSSCSANTNNNQNKSIVNQDEYPAQYSYIKDFEKMGFGMFVHFGLYSQIGKGEWYLNKNPETNDQEYEKLVNTFDVDQNWAQDLVQTAKNAGANYITITTRHHDGFSLYDTCGINEYDAPHSKCHRDLIKEFVDACNQNGIKPFFYHTLLDWHEKTYTTDFNKYLDYLYNSIEILCKNYGQIGGFWFDGSWDNQDADWKFDRLYSMVKSYQPQAMIINNTGQLDRGMVSSPLIDSVTYERDNPKIADNSDRPRAGEMCESVNDHWGYTVDDITNKPVTRLLDTLLICREHNCNFLLNVGPQGNGLIDNFDKQTLANIGKWIKYNQGFIYNIRMCDITAENASIVKDKNHYFAIIRDVPMQENVLKGHEDVLKDIKINTDKKVKNAKYLDNNAPIEIKDNKFKVEPFAYGISLYARVVQFDLE